MDLLPPLRHPRRVQPLHRRLDGGAAGIGSARKPAHTPDMSKTGNHRRAADNPRRSRPLDEEQMRRHAACRPRRDQDTQPRLRRGQRQPIFREPVQNAQIPARVPRAVRFNPGRSSLLQGVLQMVQHPAPPLGDMVADARDRALRQGTRSDRGQTTRARPRTPATSRTVRTQTAPGASTARGRMDQSTATTTANSRRRNTTIAP